MDNMDNMAPVDYLTELKNHVPDIFSHILTKLDNIDLFNIRLTSKVFNNFIINDVIKDIFTHQILEIPKVVYIHNDSTIFDFNIKNDKLFIDYKNKIIVTTLKQLNQEDPNLDNNIDDKILQMQKGNILSSYNNGINILACNSQYYIYTNYTNQAEEYDKIKNQFF